MDCHGGRPGAAASAGSRLVGVTLRVKNNSASTDTNDADTNTSIVGTNKQVYSPTFTSLAGCTDFNNGTYALAPAATEVGCVAFAVPSTVRIVQVKYSADSLLSVSVATWTLTPPA